MKWKRVVLWMGVLCSGVFALEQPKQRDLVFMRTPETLDAGNPASFTPGRLKEIADAFPAYGPDNEINVGVGAIFSYFRFDIAVVEQSLRRFLQTSEAANVPVWIKLDGEQWWGARPDLWNWWDPSKPGYNPKNAENVEWTGWSPDHAIKIAWRDWGRQLRVLPPPNLMSPSYRKACDEAMERLVPIVVDWYNRLPKKKKGLFVGLNVGWESGIGTSSYYYPNGNDLLDKPESGDPPGGGVVLDDVLSRGMVQIGYAAVSTAGLRTRGDITENDLAEVVRLHLLDLSRKASELGIPKGKLFTHVFGNAKGEKLYDSAVNGYATPGWSEYWNSTDILKNKGVVRNLHRAGVEQWGSVEWLLLYPVDDAPIWYAAIQRTINAPGLKMMCIYNWENIDQPGSAVVRVVNRVIAEGLSPQELPTLGTGDGASSPYDVKD